MAAAPIRRRAGAGDERALLEAAQDAAQVARIESQVAAQVRGRRFLAVRQVVQDAHLRQRERTVVRAAAQHADLPGVEPVEAARRLPPPPELPRPHHAYARPIRDSGTSL